MDSECRGALAADADGAWVVEITDLVNLDTWPEGTRLIVRRERPHPDASRVTVASIDAFSAEFDALWERARGSYAMCVRRDRAYLTWKYRQPPHRRYALHAARRERCPGARE